MFIFRYLLLIAAACSLSGCGTGGITAPAPAPVTTRTGVLKLATGGVSSVQLAGASFSLLLPAGVAPAQNSNGSLDTSIAVVSGVASGGTVLTPIYTAASGSSKGKLEISFASNLPAGFPAGEFISITLNVASHATPQLSEFTVSEFKPVDVMGNIADGLTATPLSWVMQ